MAVNQCECSNSHNGMPIIILIKTCFYSFYYPVNHWSLIKYDTFVFQKCLYGMHKYMYMSTFTQYYYLWGEINSFYKYISSDDTHDSTTDGWKVLISCIAVFFLRFAYNDI